MSEDKRISEERAEADVDAEEAHEHHFHQDPNRRFVWRAWKQRKTEVGAENVSCAVVRLWPK